MREMIQKDFAYLRPQWRSLLCSFAPILAVFIIVYSVLNIAGSTLPLVVMIYCAIYSNSLLLLSVQMDHQGDFPLVNTLPVPYRAYLASRTVYSLLLLLVVCVIAWPIILLIGWGLQTFFPAIAPLPLAAMAWFPLAVGINLAIAFPFCLRFQVRSLRRERLLSVASIILGSTLCGVLGGYVMEMPTVAFFLPILLGLVVILLSGALCQIFFGGRRV